MKSSHVLSIVSGQSRHLTSRINPRADSAFADANSALKFWGTRSVRPSLSLVVAAASYCRCGAPLPLQRSRRPKSADHLQLLPPTPVGNSVPARIDSDYLRSRDREPLRSASRLLGFPIDVCHWDPGHRPVADPGSGRRYLQYPICLVTPDSFLGRQIIAVDYYRGTVSMRLVTAVFTKCRDGN